MRVHLAKSLTAFAEAVTPFLAEREGINGGLLAPLIARRDTPTLADHELAIWVEGEGVVRIAGLRLAGRALVLSAGSREAAAAAGLALAEGRSRTDLVSGPSDIAAAFAQAWQRQAGGRCELVMAFRYLDTRAVQLPQSIAGHMRHAEPADAEPLTDWMLAMIAEAIPHEARDRATALAHTHATIERQRLYVWEQDALLVAMAVTTRPTPRGIAISGVYTPPPLREQGIAGNLVAALTAKELAEGRVFCCLFTDASNPVSNRVYERIGYVHRCDTVLLRLTPPTT